MRSGIPTLLGLPYDASSSYLRGAAAAPEAIRSALRCDSSNSWSEGLRDMGLAESVADAGDLALPLGLIQSLSGPVVGADVVEFNPSQDPSGITGPLCAKLVKELADRMLSC